jgi:hypothetical protein
MTTDRAVVWVTDLNDALGHYTAVFGRDPDHIACGEHASWRLDDGRTMTVEAQPSCAGTAAIDIAVADVTGCAARLAAAGIAHTLLTVGDVPVLTAEDPDGNLVVVLGGPTDRPAPPD